MNYLFDKNWFRKNQRKLLWLLNTPIIKVWFRWVMRIKKYDCKEKITQITPNSISWGDKLIWNTKKRRLEIERTTDFRTHNKYSKRLYHAFKYVWYLFHAWDLGFANRFAPQLNLGFDTLTVYPTPGSYDDWLVKRSGVNESASTIFAGDGNGTGGAGGAAASTPFLWASTTNNQFQYNQRGLFNILTSALTTSVTISAATFSLYDGNDKANNLNLSAAHAALSIVGTNSASNTTPANADYQTFGTTKFATDISYPPTTSAYNTWTFNASGIAAISKDGVTKLGVVFAVDADRGTPNWISNAYSYVAFVYSDAAGTTTDPKLVITYSVVSNTGNFFQFLS